MNITFHPFGAALVGLTFLEFAAAIAIAAAGVRATRPGATTLFVLGGLVLAASVCTGDPFGQLVLDRFSDSPALNVVEDALDLTNRLATALGLGCVAAGVWRATSAHAEPAVKDLP